MAGNHYFYLWIIIQTMILPYYVAFVPMMHFRLQKFRMKKEKDAKASCLQKLWNIILLTPLVVIYLLFIDLLFLILSGILFPIVFFLLLLTRQMKHLHHVEEFNDTIFRNAFSIQQRDIQGFRRLRTTTQLLFESLPEIFFQLYILNELSKPEY
jgi:fatty acid desaturase